MAKLKHALPVLLLVSLVFSCNKDESIRAGSNAAMDIADAQNLVLIDGSANGLTGGRLKTTQDLEFNALYKIDASGNLQEVHLSEGEGSIDVDKIIRFNTDYLLMLGKFVINDKNYFSLLVRKSDGVVFDFVDYDLNMEDSKLGENFIKADGDGNLYYPMYNQIKKLDITDPQTITSADYLPSGQMVWFFDIDPAGNLLYNYEADGTGINKLLRIKKVGGGIFDAAVEGRTYRDFWLGNNGNFYMNGTSETGAAAIYKATIANNEVTIDNVWSDDTNAAAGMVKLMFSTSLQGAYRIRKPNSILFLETFFDADHNGVSWEFFEDTNTVQAIDLPPLKEGSVFAHSPHYYYIGTGTDLYKVDIQTHSYVKLLTSGDYEVYAMSVDENDNLRFNGLRFSDGKRIFAEIKNGGSVAILDEDLDKKAVTLTRLN
jgi:hypothetical protein